MSISVRQWIIQILGNDFDKIKISNGYNYDVKAVYKNFVEATNISEWPIIYFELVPETFDDNYESRNFQDAKLQVLIGGYVQYDENNPANINVSAEKLIADINACLYQVKNQSCVLNTYPSKISWDIINIDPYLNPNLSGIVEVRVLLQINYLNSSDVLRLINSDLPTTPNISSPANGGTVTTSYPQIDWNSVSGALSYHIMISTDSLFNSTYINQNYLVDNSYTVPLDKILTNGSTYYFRVRAYNNNGYGNWSSTYSFLVNSTDVTPIQWNQVQGANGWWNSYTSSGLLIGATAGVSAMLDKIGSRHLTQATAGARPALSANAYGSLSSVYFNPTFASDSRYINYNDSASAFGWTNSNSGSFMLVFMSDGTNYDFSSSYFCPVSRSNTSFGSQFSLVRGVATGPAGYALAYPFASGDSIVFQTALNRPHQIIVTHSGSAHTAYLNGAKIKEFTKSNTNFTSEASSFLNLGTYYNGSANFGSGRYTGHIFEFGFSLSAISSSSVAGLYEAFKQRFNL